VQPKDIVDIESVSFHASNKARLLTAVGGFFGYGIWAAIVNFEYGILVSSKVALTQGAISFILTLSVNLLIERVYTMILPIKNRKLITVLTASASLVLISFVINLLANTPNIFITILPGAVFGTFYVYSYLSFNLRTPANNC